MQPIASSSGSARTARTDGETGPWQPASGQHKQQLGRRGEELAAAYLERAGFRVLDRNWRCDAGEIDIVASDGPAIVGCEVKTRRSQAFGPPQEGVDEQKLARLYRLIHRWVSQSGQAPDLVRVDVIGVLLSPGRAPRIDHLAGAC